MLKRPGPERGQRLMREGVALGRRVSGKASRARGGVRPGVLGDLFLRAGRRGDGTGTSVGTYKSTLGRIGCVVIILFSLMTADVFRIPWLTWDTSLLGKPRSHSLLTSGAFGVLVAAG